MSVEVVEVSAKDSEEWRSVISWVYSRKPPGPEAYPLEEGETRLLARLDGAPAGACSVYDYTVARGPSDLTCGGVAGVATRSEFRRLGVAEALMRDVLVRMRDQGTAVSALYPYRGTFYRKFGYETCGWRWQFKCPQDRLPRVDARLPVRQIDPDAIATLDPVYEGFVRRRSGSPLRTPQDWKNRLGKTTPMVYAIGEPYEAYLWANLEDFWGEATIGEVAWTSHDGYVTALSLIRSMCSNMSSAVWNEPPDSPFLASYFDQGVTATLSRPTMFRVVDIAAAVRSLKPVGEGRFGLRVSDPDCPWNEGDWQIEFADGEACAKKGGTAELRTTAATFAQALMGQPSLTQLARQGLVEVADPRALAVAEGLLPSSPVVCMEFF